MLPSRGMGSMDIRMTTSSCKTVLSNIAVAVASVAVAGAGAGAGAVESELLPSSSSSSSSHAFGGVTSSSNNKVSRYTVMLAAALLALLLFLFLFSSLFSYLFLLPLIRSYPFSLLSPLHAMLPSFLPLITLTYPLIGHLP